MLSIDDQGPFPACPAPFNLARYVLWENKAEDDKIAMAILGQTGAERWSYGKLRARVLRTAQGLLAQGLSPGDRVALRLGNTPDFPIVFLAAIAAGILPVPLSMELTEDEATRLLNRVEPKGVVSEGGSLDPNRLAEASPLEEFDTGSPDRPAYLIFTSGTSGNAMAVQHAHRAIWARRAMIDGWYKMTAADRVMHAGAFNWTYTLGTGLCDPWSLGATALVPKAGSPPAMLPLLMKRHDATMFAAAPGVFRQILRADVPPLPKLRHALTAGEKLPDTVKRAWEQKTGTQIFEAFGQSECSTFISSHPDRPAPDGALGFAQPGRRVAILGPDGPAALGQEGEIAIDATDPGVMLGYLNAPTETASRFIDGWFLTGDTGVMGEDGAVTYLGRRDDILTAGGFRISPLDIENAMMTYPGILDAAAVDEAVNQETRVVALHYAAETPLSEDELKHHAATHLARYKQPRVFHHHPSLPRGRGGKLLRGKLRAARDIS